MYDDPQLTQPPQRHPPITTVLMPPGTARRAEVIAALKTADLKCFECKDSEGWMYCIIAYSHADARYQAQRICELARRQVVATTLIDYSTK